MSAEEINAAGANGGTREDGPASPVAHLTLEERAAKGKAAREAVPRSSSRPLVGGHVATRLRA